MRHLIGSILFWFIKPRLDRQRRLDHRPAHPRAPRFAVVGDAGEVAFVSAEAMGVRPRGNAA